jgi:hypothetical protein
MKVKQCYHFDYRPILAVSVLALVKTSARSVQSSSLAVCVLERSQHHKSEPQPCGYVDQLPSSIHSSTNG